MWKYTSLSVFLDCRGFGECSISYSITNWHVLTCQSFYGVDLTIFDGVTAIGVLAFFWGGFKHVLRFQTNVAAHLLIFLYRTRPLYRRGKLSSLKCELERLLVFTLYQAL